MDINRNSSKKFTADLCQPIEVLMMGMGLDVKGGITSVQKLIVKSHLTRLDRGDLPRINIQQVPTSIGGSSWQNLWIFARAIIILIWKILRKKVDVIHIHFAERGSTLRKLILISIGLVFRQSIVLHAHGATYKEFYAGLPPLVQNIIKFLFSRCSQMIVLSKSWQDYYVNKLGLDNNRVVVLYNPVEMPTSVPDRRGRKSLKFIFLGLIGKRGGPLDLAKSVLSFPKQDKGAFDLIEAFAAMEPNDLERTELILAGNGDLESAHELITKLGLTDKIKILSWLDPEQRDRLLNSADGFMLPSYHEGLPMSMLEAMSWGLPVIVTPVGGIPEMVRDRQNGLLVDPGDHLQLTQALHKLIADESLRISLGSAARESVEHLNIDDYMSSLSHLYTSVVKRKVTVDPSRPHEIS
jgi:glycosyltransferase involved in cell wall biosynthesis